MPPIYGIFLGHRSTSDTARLKELSDLTGGTFTRVDPSRPEDIENVIQGLLNGILVATPPTAVVITNTSLVPPQVSRSSQLITNPDGSVSIVLDSILALAQGRNDLQVSITMGGSTKTYRFSVQADGPQAGSSSSTLQCHALPTLTFLNPSGNPDPSYPSGPTTYDVVLTRSSSDLVSALVHAVSTDPARPQPWGDTEDLLLPLRTEAQGIATNVKDDQAFNGAVNAPAARNGILEASPDGRVRANWVHPRDPREFAVFEFPGGGRPGPPSFAVQASL
jgi:hypothetical protein